jgi:two-component system response regulator NreC
MTAIRVFLVDDHSVLRQGVRLLIDAQSDMEVVGESARGRGVSREIAGCGGADVVVVDISMPDTTGPRLAAELKAECPESKIVALTRHGERAYVQQMLQAGADGYVLKQTVADVLIAAIRAVASGGTYLDPSVAGKLSDAIAGGSVRGVAPDAITAREREVLTLVAYGHTNKEIAALLGITVKTVETHKANAMQKLEITSRADLVRFALAQGWLER